MLSRLSPIYIVFLTFLFVTTFSGKCYAVVYGYIPNSADSNLSVINTENGTTDPTKITVGINPYGVATAPAGDYVYVTNKSSTTISQVEIATGNFTTHTVGTDPVGVAVSPDGIYVYVANQDGSLSILEVTDFGLDFSTIPVGTTLFGIAVSPDGKSIYVTDDTQNKVHVINQEDLTVSASLDVGTAPKGIAVTPSGYYVVVANSDDDTVSLITTGTNVVSTPIAIGTPDVEGEPVVDNSPFGVAITNDSLFAYVTNTLTDSVSKISLSTLAVTNIPLTAEDSPQGIAMHPYGSSVYVVNNAGTVKSIAVADDIVSLDVFNVGASPVGLGKFFPPEVPLDLTATPVGDTGINLSWTDNADNETGFKIERKKFIVGGYDTIATVVAGVTTYNDRNLGFYANYYYRVSAYNDLGSTIFSNEAFAQTNREPYSGCFIATAAYGSLLEPQVRLLREFRDRYLTINQPGRAFLDMYYEYSPPIAQYIANHNFWRFMVRWSLLPLVAMSWLSLTIGLLPTMLVLSSLSGLAAFIFLKRKQAISAQ